MDLATVHSSGKQRRISDQRLTAFSSIRRALVFENLMNTIFLSPIPLWGLLPLYIHSFPIFTAHLSSIQAPTWVLVTSAVCFNLQWVVVGEDTVQVSSPHKCGQESCCSVLNVAVAALLVRYFMIATQLDMPNAQPLQGNLQHIYSIMFWADPLDRVSSA